MHRITLALVIVATLFAASCKRNTPAKPAISHAAPMVPGPSATQMAEEDHSKLLESLEPFPVPDGPGIAEIGPDGETWTKYDSGVFVHDLRRVDGRHPQYGQLVAISYVGTFPGQPDKPFDSSKHFEFVVGKKDGVIKGLNIGISTMAIGTKRRILIPSDLAYGEHGSPPSIPPNQALMFEVELLSISGEAVEMPKPPSTSDLMKMGPFLETQPDTAPSSQPR